MTDLDNEDSLRKMLKAAYRPVAPSSEFKEQMRKRLAYEVHHAGVDAAVSPPILARPRVVIPTIVAVAAGLIGYGVWLSANLVPTFLP